MSVREEETRDVTDAASRRAVQLHRLASAALLLNSTLAVDELLQLITGQARETVGAHLAVGSLSADIERPQAIAAVARSDKYADWADDGTAASGNGLAAVVCAENRPFRFTQAQLEADPSWRGSGEQPPLRGWLAAPLIDRDGVNLGSIQLSDKEDGSEFTAEDEAILVQLAQMASASIVNARLYEELEASRLELEAIFSAVADGVTAQGPSGELLFANEAAARLVGYATAADFLAAPISEVLDRFEILDEERRPFPLDRLPGRAALRGEEPPPVTLC